MGYLQMKWVLGKLFRYDVNGSHDAKKAMVLVLMFFSI